MDVQFSFLSISIAIIKLFVLMFVGVAIYKLKLINDKFLDTLSLLLVRVFFPALIIYKTVSNFSFSEYGLWWVLPLVACVFSIVGMLIGWGASKFIKDFGSDKEFMSSCAFQNCGYLPMNLILFAFSGMMGDRLLVFVFLYILGFNIFMWSLMPLFLKGTLREKFHPKVLLNPPVVATLISLLWVAVLGKGSMPHILASPLNQLGAAAFPISMITLGAYLVRYQGHIPHRKLPLFLAMGIKLLLFPAIVLVVLMNVAIGADYKFFIFLEAIMPSAVSLIVIGSYTGADNKFFSSIIFYTHLLSIVTIPLWLAFFRMLGQ